MKNLHYDLVKLLHSKLDNVWRLEKHYLKDAKECVRCRALFGKLLKAEKDGLEMLKKELTEHGKTGLK